MDIKTAIQKAIEGGYRPSHTAQFSQLVEGDYTYQFQIGDSVFLDPLFWQSLGKSLGWNTDKYFYTNMVEGMERGKEYLEVWHRFIDHLAEGKDAESFFKNI